MGLSDSKYYWNEILVKACANGNIKVVGLAISKGANNFNIGLVNACYNGHLDIAILMVYRCDDKINTYNTALNNACYNGHIGIVNLLLTEGANDFVGGLVNACYKQHKEIILLMINKGVDINKCFDRLSSKYEDVCYLQNILDELDFQK